MALNNWKFINWKNKSIVAKIKYFIPSLGLNCLKEISGKGNAT
jgi:hypothetical protein